MEMTTDAVAIISKRCQDSGLVQKVTEVHLLGDLVTVGYEVEGSTYVMTEYLRPASTLPAQIVDAVRRGLHRGPCSASVDHDYLQCEPIEFNDVTIECITSRFTRTGAFKALNGWVVGTMYLVHGEYTNRPCIITGNYHGLKTVCDAVELAVEIGAIQYLADSKHAGYTIRIDGNQFHLPRG